MYGHSGTDARSRANREKCYAEVVPQLLTIRKHAGCIGGDFNSIMDKADATHHPEAKLSGSLMRVTKVFDMKNSYRTMYPKVKAFSRYYGDSRGQGATRIDTQYHFGDITIKEAEYFHLSFSDHHGIVVFNCLPDPLARILCPKGSPSFKLRDDVINDQEFQQS